jgi:hypothetical protein
MSSRNWEDGALDTFMTYIHAQLPSFSKDLAMHMSTQLPFHNLAATGQTNTNLTFSHHQAHQQWHST